MAEFLGLSEAVSRYIKPGASVALEGFTHLIPFAAGHEIIRQRLTGLTLIRMTPDLLYDQMIGCGCARKLVFSWGGNPGVGSLHRLSDAVEHGWPNALELEEHSHAAMAHAYAAGAANMPCAIFRGYLGSDLAKVNPRIQSVVCPFTGERLAAVPALRPDVTVIHAQKADRRGNVLVERYRRRAEGSRACRRARHRDGGGSRRRSGDRRARTRWCCRAWTIHAIAVAPGGARPSYTHGYYQRDNAFYTRWDDISRDRDRFRQWIDDEVRPVGDAGATVESLMSYTATEMMTVAAARALGNEDICFVGIGLPSAACNLARLTHAPRLTLVYESGTIETKPQRAAVVDRRRRVVRDGADDRAGDRDVPGTGSRADASRSVFSAARRWIGTAI